MLIWGKIRSRRLIIGTFIKMNDFKSILIADPTERLLEGNYPSAR
jgi:hypothetical protein